MRPFPQSCCMSSLQHGVLPTQNVPALSLSQCDRSHINFFSVPQGCTWTHTSPQNTYFHIDTCTHVCRQLQKCTRNIWGYFQIQCMNLCLTLYLISLGKHSLSLNVKKKKKGNTIRSYFFQRGREVPHESHLVAGDITEIWQEFSGSFLPFLSSGYWSPILGSYLHSGPSPMCNIISSF